jgi:peptide/nickel transport system permease protein
VAAPDRNAIDGLGTPATAVADPVATPIDPALTIPGAAQPIASGRRLRAPQWALLLLRNPKSCFGIVTILAMVTVALLAPVIAQNSPSDIVALPGQPPNRHFWFGTTDQGYDVFSQVVWGARTSLAVGAAAAVLSTVIAATLEMLAAYAGGWVDDTINLVTNIFLVIPALPLLIVVYSFVPTRGPGVMVLILGLTTWAVEARILRGQALSLVNRDFIQAAKISGEGTWRIVFGEIMPNMVSRIAAGFLLVFYLSIIFAAGLEFLGFGDLNKVTWGTTLYWAQNNSTVLQGAWWHFVFPGVALAIAVAALVFINYGIDELANPRLRRPGRRGLGRRRAAEAR